MEQYPAINPDDEPDEEPVERLPPGSFQNDPWDTRIAAKQGGEQQREVPRVEQPRANAEPSDRSQPKQD